MTEAAQDLMTRTGPIQSTAQVLPRPVHSVQVARQRLFHLGISLLRRRSGKDK